jgi:hypothetical protein
MQVTIGSAQSQLLSQARRPPPTPPVGVNHALARCLSSRRKDLTENKCSDTIPPKLSPTGGWAGMGRHGTRPALAPCPKVLRTDRPAPAAHAGHERSHVPLPAARQRITNPRPRQPMRVASPPFAPHHPRSGGPDGAQAKGPRPWDHPPPHQATADDPARREPNHHRTASTSTTPSTRPALFSPGGASLL